MHTNMQYLSSRRGAYSGICALVVFLSLILLSGTMGLQNNTGYGQISQELAHQVGAQSSGSLNGHPTYSASAIRPDAGFFINLTVGMRTALLWGILLGLLSLVVIGVKQRSVAMTTLPGIVFIIAVTMVGQDYFRVYNGSSENPVILAAAMTGIGAIALAVLNRWRPAMIPRTPDVIPSDAPSERTEAH